MADPTEEFFGVLGRRGHEPLLEKATGTLRFELDNGGRTDYWLVAIDRGDVAVSHEPGDADLVLRAPKPLFDRIASGEANAMAALLRGAVELDGNLQLIALFQRLFPGPPSAHGPLTTAGADG